MARGCPNCVKKEVRIAKICENGERCKRRASEKGKYRYVGGIEGQNCVEPKFKGSIQRRWWRTCPVGEGFAGEKDPRMRENAIPLGDQKPISESKSKVSENGKVDLGFQNPKPDNESWLFPKFDEANRIELPLNDSNGKDKGEFFRKETKSLVSFSLGKLEVKVSNYVKNIKVGSSALEEICDYLSNKTLICRFI
ncbi:hypothetical protein KI387_019404, partial [Taxus chinensis]